MVSLPTWVDRQQFRKASAQSRWAQMGVVMAHMGDCSSYAAVCALKRGLPDQMPPIVRAGAIGPRFHVKRDELDQMLALAEQLLKRNAREGEWRQAAKNKLQKACNHEWDHSFRSRRCIKCSYVAV